MRGSSTAVAVFFFVAIVVPGLSSGATPAARPGGDRPARESAPEEDSSSKKDEAKDAAKEQARPSDPALPGIRSPWSVFRGGPLCRGRRSATEGGLPDRPERLWTFDAGSSVQSTAAIARGRAYLGTREGVLLALELRPSETSGKAAWRFRAEGGIRSSPSWRPSPGEPDGRLYFGDMYGIFYAVDALTGELAWKHDTEGGEIVSSAAFHEDTVLFGSYDHRLLCLDAESGEVRWVLETGGPIHSSLAVTAERTFASSCDSVLRVVDVTGGEVRTEVELPGYTASTPAVQGGRLFVGTFANEVVAVDWRAGEIRWNYSPPEREFPFPSSPAVAGDRLVIGGNDKSLHCLNTRTGEALWTFPTRSKVESSPVIVGDRVVCGSSDKNLYVLGLARGEEIWRWQADDGFLASPAVGEAVLVIGAANGLVYAFDLRDGKAAE